jgi:hypothetical protein
MEVLPVLQFPKILVQHRLHLQVIRVETATRSICSNRSTFTTITMAYISHHRHPVPAILFYPLVLRAHPILSRDLRHQ